MGSSKKFCPVVTKLCAVTKLVDLTVLSTYGSNFHLYSIKRVSIITYEIVRQAVFQIRIH
jgi:hypothetical protein